MLARARIADFTKLVTPAQRLDIIKEDPADNRILECALESKSDYLVTRDNHVLKLKSFGDIRIIKVVQFLEIVREDTKPRCMNRSG